jgi:hypothetical protein
MKVEQALRRAYEYHGDTLVVTLESDFGWQDGTGPARPAGFVAIPGICRTDTTVAVSSPLRFADAVYRPFVAEANAVLRGYTAAPSHRG